MNPRTAHLLLDAKPSPDGRSFSLTDWSTGNLVLHNPENNTSRSLTGTASYASGHDQARRSCVRARCV